MDEFLNPAPDGPLPSPQHHVIEPRRTGQRPSPEPKKKSRKFVDDIKLVFDFHIPFTSHNKKKAKKPKKEHRPNDTRGRPTTPVYVAVPPELRQPPPPIGYPGPGNNPVPHPPPPRGPAIARPDGHITPPITVHSLSSTNSSPSPISPLRQHHHWRARSLSLNRQYEERKKAIRERERRALAENEARIRAERDAQRLRDERDRERRRNEDLRAREQRRLDDQRRLRIEDAERERRRRGQEEEERLAAARVAYRRREELDRRREAEAMVERERRARARRRREEEQRQQLIEEERARLARQRRARIPRGPRHAVVLHHHHHHHHERENDEFEQRARENFEDRGDRVINNAIRAEQLRQAGRGTPPNAQPRWPPESGLRRRGTIAAGERRFYDDDLRRWGRRWF
ncbi:MAG: hypothetical protein Q9166_005682 [cf. Caloplaca sp. 2 TL-2023]